MHDKYSRSRTKLSSDNRKGRGELEEKLVHCTVTTRIEEDATKKFPFHIQSSLLQSRNLFNKNHSRFALIFFFIHKLYNSEFCGIIQTRLLFSRQLPGSSVPHPSRWSVHHLHQIAPASPSGPCHPWLKVWNQLISSSSPHISPGGSGRTRRGTARSPPPPGRGRTPLDKPAPHSPPSSSQPAPQSWTTLAPSQQQL